MARKHAKIILDRFETSHTHGGTRRCAVVKLKGTTQWDNPIGRICEAPGGYEYSYVGTRALLGPRRTKAAAILGVVKGYKAWIG